MLIAIISDVHNNVVNLKKVLDYCTTQKIQTLICCGDLASDETLEFMNDNFSGVIYYTFGNMDNDQLRDFSAKGGSASGGKSKDKYKNTFLYKDFGEVEIGKKKIALVHYPEKAKKLCETGKYDFVFYGHTHKPWIEKIDNCTMLNPGNVAGEIYPPTFAVWNTENDKFELIRIHSLE